MRTLLMSVCLTIVSDLCNAQSPGAIRFAPELFPTTVSGAVCGFSPDGMTMYFAREDTVSGQIHLFSATRQLNSWTNERLLSFSGKHNDMGGRLSKDGGVFYFTSDRPDGSSRKNDTWNIWVTAKSGDAWTTPRPLSEINNKGMECCPLPLPDGTLVFSADREPATAWWILEWDVTTRTESFIAPLNQDRAWQWPSSLNRKADIMFLNSMKRPDTYGMDDLYVSFFDGNSWSTPQNLGPGVNTEAYEDGAILSYDEEWLIFCRHATASTPSQVLQVRWKPLLEKLKAKR